MVFQPFATLVKKVLCRLLSATGLAAKRSICRERLDCVFKFVIVVPTAKG
jgi:hypothetical protein